MVITEITYLRHHVFPGKNPNLVRNHHEKNILFMGLMFTMTTLFAADLTAKLTEIRIPEFKAENATVSDVIILLTTKIRENDPDKKGINFIFLPGEATPEEKKITIHLRNSSVKDILDTLVVISNLTYTVEDNVVTIKPKK